MPSSQNANLTVPTPRLNDSRWCLWNIYIFIAARLKRGESWFSDDIQVNGVL